MRILKLFIVCMWPIAILTHNTPPDAAGYLLPVILLLCSYFLWKRKKEWWGVPLIFVAIVSPKLALFPLLLFAALLVTSKTRKTLLYIFFFCALFISAMFSKEFIGQTVARITHDEQQALVQQTNLYDSIFVARVMHNKVRVVSDKVIDRFFALIDPNNYFFGFHPRQIQINNQNLQKYPFVAIIFFVAGFLGFSTLKEKKWVFICLFALLVNLSFLTVFDRNDAILMLPITLITLHGIDIVKEYKHAGVLFAIAALFSCVDLIRQFLT